MISSYDHTDFERHCQALPAVLQRLRESHEIKVDEVLTLAQLKLDEDCRLTHNGAKFTGRGFGALAHLVDMPPALVCWLSSRNYDRELSRFLNGELLRLQFEDSQASRADRRIFARFRGDGDGQLVCRALFSDRYCPVDSWPVMDMVSSALSSSEFDAARVHRLSYDGDELLCNVLWPGGDRTVGGEAYKCGVAIQTSEVGTLRLRVAGVVTRLVCSNGLILVGELGESVSKRHVGRIDMVELAQGIRAAVGSALERADRALIQLEASRAIEVRDADRAIVQLSRELKLTRDQTRAWLEGHDATLDEPTVGEVSAFSVVNGLTRGAQTAEFEPTTRSYLESLAGRLLAPSLDSTEATMRDWWNEAQLRARSLSDDAIASFRD